MFNKQNKKIAALYVALQGIIWAKTIVFFQLYGFGKAGNFNRVFFPQDAILFNFVFHETMHVAIGVLALLFGANMQKIELGKLTVVVFAAVSLHNVSYWFTKSHPSALLSLFDFASDYLILTAFVLVGFALNRAKIFDKFILFETKAVIK
ncbi:MAG: hypothetical protein Q8N60_00780 [Candidatus Diapherotrites archaeon]|nr:hypothetical protein [Candidatus Diapherotrites archaeon]